MRYKVHKQDIYLHKYGHGPQLVLMIPGGPGLSHDYLIPTQHRFDPDLYSVFIYEPSGYFNSNTEYFRNIRDYGTEIDGLLKTLHFNDVTIVGHSFGACLALEYATKIKSDVRLVLSNSYLSGKQLQKEILASSAGLPNEFLSRLNKARAEKNTNTYQQIINQEWIPQTTITTSFTDELMNSITAYSSSQLVPHYLGADFFEMEGAITDWDREKEATSVENPSLIIAGRKDYISIEASKTNARSLPNAKIHIDHNSGHMTPFESPKDFANTVMSFISDLT